MQHERPSPSQLLRVGELLELNGDWISAVITYRRVLATGDDVAGAEARRRLESLMQRAYSPRPA
ncbi:MAG: hypothetical protein ABR498_01850 [Candidatus Dormibacteria bacterium]